MNKPLYILYVLSILLFSCKNNNQSVREPLNHTRQKVDMKSVNNNRNRNKREEEYIKKLIKQDSTHQYKDSGHGFWYYYEVQKPNEAQKIEVGDKVRLNYEMRDLSNNIIYSTTEIGDKTYWVDHENYFRGFCEAVKLMKKGEEAWFIFPSNAAYGYHGDEKKIGSSVPLKMKLIIKSIKKHQKKDYEKN